MKSPLTTDLTPAEPARGLESLSAAKRKLLAKRIRGEAGSGGAPTGVRREPSLLVDLQPERPAGVAVAAGRPPFFCVHAIGGAVLCYRDLALGLGGEQPFYGIQAAGLEGGHAVDDLPAMAARYAAAVEAAAPHGPYLLGGWSFGGVVAFEMAHQMQQRGRPVALVALLVGASPSVSQRTRRSRPACAKPASACASPTTARCARTTGIASTTMPTCGRACRTCR